MPELKKQEPPKPPETKYEVPAEEFIKAVKGESFTKGKGLYRMKGKGIKRQELFPEDYFDLKEENDYVILIEAMINDSECLEFLNTELTDYKTGIIFFRSILPGINIQNTITQDWLLLNSFINGDFKITDQSQIARININFNSQIKEIIIQNSKSESIIIESNSRSALYIRDNSQADDIWISNHSQADHIWIAQYSQVKYISAWVNSRIGGIIISQNSQSGSIKIQSGQSGEICFENGSMGGSIDIDNAQGGDINIRSFSQVGDIDISNQSQIERILFEEKGLSGDIKIANSYCQSLTVVDNYSSFKLFNATIPLMKFNKCCIPELAWQAGARGELYITNSKINFLNLEHTALLKDALLSITDSMIFIAQMNKLTVQGQLLLTNLKLLESPFIWDPFLTMLLFNSEDEELKPIDRLRKTLLKAQEKNYNYNKEKLLKEVSEKPLWRMVNTSFGKAEITGSKLKGFVFEYRDSKLLDTFISGTEIPRGDIEIYKPKNDFDRLEQKISIYNQLKKIFENQGNIVEATWYHSKAMDNQQRLLQLNFRMQKKRWFSEEGFEFFNFKLNKLSNNHGESWRKALWFVLISSLIVYSLYYTSINYHKEFSFKGIGNFIGRFFSFLNFTRREDFMAEKEDLNAFSYFFDYLGRVVTGFGIYQLIAAFRRHGRK